MYSFINDYSEGAHPKIMEALNNTNLEQTVGYGFDPYCQKARELIKKACAAPSAAVYFLMGGTQTNQTVISALLRPHQGVYGAVTSHINTHEAGAIEHVGHKVLAIETSDGKLTAEGIAKAYQRYKNDPTHLHWVQPKMVYISQPTEIGTLYHKKELAALYKVCQKHQLYLYIDGARLGYALNAIGNDLTLPALAKLCDLFYIGGTKCGALLGEALVITNPALQPDFFTLMKQSGAVLAKGRILGLQFMTLFANNLYGKICKAAVSQAAAILKVIKEKGWQVIADSPTNQIFLVMPNAALKKLSKSFLLDVGEKYDKQHTIVRICTSWCTQPEQVEKLLAALQRV